jgi:hypothetical protein
MFLHSLPLVAKQRGEPGYAEGADNTLTVPPCSLANLCDDEEALPPSADYVLAIVAPIVDGPEQPPAASQEGWLRFGIEHEMVLDKAVNVLSRTIYQGSLRDAIPYLHKLARYHPEANEYARVREKAHKALVDMAELQPGKPHVVQRTMLERIADWLEQDF